MQSEGIPEVVAHRGDSGQAPENTLAAIRRAAALPVTMIEIDVHLSRDEEVIVMHDATVDRTTNGSGEISALTLEELRRLDAGSWKDERYSGERIPTLREACEAMGSDVLPCVEIKTTARTDGCIERKVIDVLQSLGLSGHAMVCSFSADCIERCLRVTGDLVYGVIGVDFSALMAHARRLDVPRLCLGARGLTATAAEETHREGRLLTTWTINHRDEARQFLDWGVDGITSDTPAAALAWRDEWVTERA